MEKKRILISKASPLRRIFYIAGVTLVITTPMALGGMYIVHKTYDFVTLSSIDTLTPDLATLPFPVGVDPEHKRIIEQENVEGYLQTPINDTEVRQELVSNSFLKKAISKLALFDWYQNLAAGASRILVIYPGERREEVAANFGKILKWTKDEEREFLTQVVSTDPVVLEGKFAPGTYIVARDAKPSVVAPLIIDRFSTEVARRYSKETEERIPILDTLTIASLLEREAYDFEDMRYISGVIWNRLFIDMHLQIDATLQYAKGTASVNTWWPTPVPNDKYLDSPFNTYQNSGLPPTPIANPSPDAILAALNPRETDCFYYFHDNDGGFHCSATYTEHVASLKKYYGRGK